MWWNPASTKLAYFRFDESKVPDFYITQDETKLQTKVDVEAYPKPGVPNPVVDLYVYDVATKKSVHIDVRDGKPFTNDVVGHYVYDMSWSPDGKNLLIHRTNRRQNILELAMCSPETGQCHAIIHEEWPTGWVENHPPMRYLADSTRFLWESERNGFKNYYLYNLSGQLLATVTNNQFEVAGITRVDEKTNTLWYTARDGDNFMKVQLHKVGARRQGRSPPDRSGVQPPGRRLARRQVLHRRGADARQGAGVEPGGCRDRQGDRGAGEERRLARWSSAASARPRSITLPRRRRKDAAVRRDLVPDQLRPEQEVSDAHVGVRRPRRRDRRVGELQRRQLRRPNTAS